MTDRGNPYVRAKARAKAKAHEKHPYRYIGLLIAGLIVALAITMNARAEGVISPYDEPASQTDWTDYNSHDPGVVADPVKVREMQAELAEEEAARPKRPSHDGWVLQSFGIGPQASSR